MGGIPCAGGEQGRPSLALEGKWELDSWGKEDKRHTVLPRVQSMETGAGEHRFPAGGEAGSTWGEVAGWTRRDQLSGLPAQLPVLTPETGPSDQSPWTFLSVSGKGLNLDL